MTACVLVELEVLGLAVYVSCVQLCVSNYLNNEFSFIHNLIKLLIKLNHFSDRFRTQLLNLLLYIMC